MQTKQRTKSVRVLHSLDDTNVQYVCSHLVTMKACQEQWRQYLPYCDPPDAEPSDDEYSGGDYSDAVSTFWLRYLSNNVCNGCV